ncbi:uncharacterized protein JCM15063_001477 [Sporobolomyces koalae]|uniref:uncharacterized protein n=1 Tax=Sporobolomyces koalae TaxID=500713 RepID=UPI00316E8459
MESIEAFKLADIINELSDSLQSLSQLAVAAPSQLAAPARAAPRQLVELVDFNHFNYTFWDIYTPDVWSLLLFFIILLAVKAASVLLLNKKAIERTREVLSAKYGREVETDVARSVLQKTVEAMVAWVMSIVVESVVLVIQCCAYRLWSISDAPLRREDIHLMLALIKVLLILYIADLFVSEKEIDIYFHHYFSFLLLFVGQATLMTTGDQVFPRLANWMILQATLALPLYYGVSLLQLERYFRLQNYKPDMQKKALQWAYRWLQFMTWIYIPQKVVPAAFTLYWLGKMWKDVDHSAWGIAWLTCAIITIPLLLLLQIFVLSDSVAAMTKFVGYRVHGGEVPDRRGPIALFFARLFGRRRSRARASAGEKEGGQSALERVTSTTTNETLTQANLAHEGQEK